MRLINTSPEVFKPLLDYQNFFCMNSGKCIHKMYNLAWWLDTKVHYICNKMWSTSVFYLSETLLLTSEWIHNCVPAGRLTIYYLNTWLKDNNKLLLQFPELKLLLDWWRWHSCCLKMDSLITWATSSIFFISCYLFILLYTKSLVLSLD